MAANARKARIATSQATNPSFNLTFLNSPGRGFGFTEPAAYFLTLGNITANTVRRDFVEYLFGMLLPVRL